MDAQHPGMFVCELSSQVLRALYAHSSTFMASEKFRHVNLRPKFAEIQLGGGYKFVCAFMHICMSIYMYVYMDRGQVSFLEIYNEGLKDLLDNRYGYEKKMEIKTDAATGMTYVTDLISMEVVHCVYVHIHVCMYMYYMYVYVCACMCVCYLCMYVCVYALCMYVCMYVYMHTCMLGGCNKHSAPRHISRRPITKQGIRSGAVVSSHVAYARCNKHSVSIGNQNHHHAG
jgi:hypothetical protein